MSSLEMEDSFSESIRLKTHLTLQTVSIQPPAQSRSPVVQIRGPVAKFRAPVGVISDEEFDTIMLDQHEPCGHVTCSNMCFSDVAKKYIEVRSASPPVVFSTVGLLFSVNVKQEGDEVKPAVVKSRYFDETNI